MNITIKSNLRFIEYCISTVFHSVISSSSPFSNVQSAESSFPIPPHLKVFGSSLRPIEFRTRGLFFFSSSSEGSAIERERTGASGSRLENRKSLNPILRHPLGRQAACLLVIQVFETQILADYRPTKLDTRGQAFCAAISYGARRRIANVPRSVNILSRYTVTNDLKSKRDGVSP